MIEVKVFNDIRKLRDEGLSNSAIAKKLRINRKTVTKYLNSNTPPNYSPRTKPTKFDSFAAFRDRTLEIIAEQQKNDRNNTKLTASEIFTFLKLDGYKGSERTVQRRIKDMKKDEPKEVFFRQVYEPGEQCQLDFKETVTLPFKSGDLIVHFFFATLPNSGKVFAKAYPNRQFESFMEGIDCFFRKIGGMTTNVRIDNLKPCVDEIYTGNERKYTAKFQRAFDYYGFGVLPCNGGKGNEKGHVERDIQTYARQFLNLVAILGIVFEDFEDLNEKLAEFIEKQESEKLKQRFLLEEKHFKPTPEKNEQIIYQTEEVSCQATSELKIKRCKATYSVPSNFIGQKCYTVVTPFVVKIFTNDHHRTHIITHIRKPDGESSILLEHVLSSLIKKPGALLRWEHKHIIFQHKEFQLYYKYLKEIGTLNPDKELLRTVNLLFNATFIDLKLAVEMAIEVKSRTPFDDIKELLLQTENRKPDDLIEPLNPDLTTYNSLIPNINQGQKAS